MISGVLFNSVLVLIAALVIAAVAICVLNVRKATKDDLRYVTGNQPPRKFLKSARRAARRGIHPLIRKENKKKKSSRIQHSTP